MGFGDPCHEHPLRAVSPPSSSYCYHCELHITDNYCYGCECCNYYIHELCHDLPKAFRHPCHDQHLLTLFESPPNSSSSSSNSPNLLCNECQNPCIGRFSYQCTTCQFHIHIKCLFTLNHNKHEHPLIFNYTPFLIVCKICGSDVGGFGFGCQSCKFYIHHECSLIPLDIKHHHVHKLTLRHNFPEECDQVYCDLCEDRDGEMDRTQSYYYCQDCDYIAHVNCCVAQPREDVLICERFTHEHPLRPNKTESLLSCTQCSYTVWKYTSEYPSFVKHPLHPHHTLLFNLEPTDDFTSAKYDFNCTECNFSIDGNEFFKFTHPLWKMDLYFQCKNSLFRCDACGELGKGSRIISDDKGEFDIHLECFALPGILEHESHPKHPLYLRWLDKSKSRCCSICRKKMDPLLWFYFCQECDYTAHMDCVAHTFLSTLQSSIMNQPDFCAIIGPEESSFKYHIMDMRPSIPSYSSNSPVLEVDSDDEYDDSDNDEDDDDDEDDNEGNCELGLETAGHVLACPKCNSLITTQSGVSTIKRWKSRFLKYRNVIANDQTLSGSEPLNFLDEQIVDELCCSICNMLIFPPTYSCASCQIFFHKSCAELPPTIIYNETTYILMAPPFPEGMSNCTHCKYPICNWAYLSQVKGFIFDVQCAAGAPLVNLTYDNELRFKRLRYDRMCKACRNHPEIGSFFLTCDPHFIYLHPECGLLPAVIKHRIHQHPLELATDLAKLDCEYFCDVCEKDLNPDVWAYRCVDWCGFRAVSHVSCVITSKKKCHFSYDIECQTWTEEKKLEFRTKERGLGVFFCNLIL